MKMKDFRITLVLVLLLIPSLSHAKTIHLNFIQALEMARDGQASVQIAHEKANQSLFKLKQAQSALMPQVTGSITQSRQTRNLEAQGISLPGRDPLVGPFNTFDMRLKLTQSLFDATSIAKILWSGSVKNIADVQLESTREEAVAYTAVLYIEAKRAREHLALAQAMLQRDAKNKSISYTRLSVGSGSALGQDESTYTLEESKKNYEDFKIQARSAEMDLLLALNLSPDNQIIFDRDAPLDIAIPDEATIKKNVAFNPEVKVDEVKVKESQAYKKIQKAAFLPQVSAHADYGASGTLPSTSMGTYSYGVGLELPLLEGGLRIKRLHEAKSYQKEAEIRLDQTQKNAFLSALKARDDVLGSQSALAKAKAFFSQSQRQYKIAKEKQNIGLGNINQVLQAEAQMARAQDELSESVAQNNLAKLSLVYSMGQTNSFLEKIGKSHKGP